MVLNALIQLQGQISKDQPSRQIFRVPKAVPAGPGRLPVPAGGGGA